MVRLICCSVFLAIFVNCCFARTSQSKNELEELISQLEGDILVAEEELECGKMPTLNSDDCNSYLDMLAFKYCSMSKDTAIKESVFGVGRSILNAVGTALGGSQILDIFKAAYYAISAGVYAIAGNGTTARRHIAMAGDTARAAFDPTVWVANIGHGITQTTAANIYSCTLSIVAAYHAFKRQGTKVIGGTENCKHGTCGTRWLSFINGYSGCADNREDFPSKCAMPGLDNPNPFLRRIIEDSGCPDSIKKYIRRKRGKAIYWVDLIRKVTRSAKKDPAVIALLAFRIYGNAVLSAVDFATTGYIGLVITMSELSGHAKNYFHGPMPSSLNNHEKRAKCAKLSDEMLGSGPKKLDDGLNGKKKD